MAETAEQARTRRRKQRDEGRRRRQPGNVLSRASSGITLTPQERAADLSIDKLSLEGMRQRAGGTKKRPVFETTTVRIEDNILDARVERTLTGASTLTIDLHDPDWVLLNSGIFDINEEGDLDPVDVRLDKFLFRLVKVNPSGDVLALTFEAQVVALLRRHDSPRSVSRADKTRAEFLEMLVREVKATRIVFHSPEKHKKQPIAKAPKAKTKKAKESPSKHGLNRKQDVRIKGKKADASQRRNIEYAVRGAEMEEAPTRAKLAMLVAGIGEGEFRTSAKNKKTGAEGTFQLLPSTQRSTGLSPGATQKVARHFQKVGFTGAGGAIALARKHPDWSPGRIAAAVEGSGENASFYDAHRKEADAILDAWGDFNGGDDDASITRIKQYRFTRGEKGKREDSWACMQRLAGEVNWRCFERNGEIWYASEPELLKQEAAAVINRNTEGVDSDSFTFDWDTGKRVKEVTFDCHADRWSFPPGAVIVLEKSGPANGRWLVSKLSRSLYDPRTSITLTKATKPKKEPAAETESVSADGDGGGSPRASSASAKVYTKAVAISKKDYPYVWGGGHAKAGRPDNGTGRDPGTGYDCSGYVAACLLAGGMLPDDWKAGVPGSGTFASSYGQAGKGQHVTVWANGGHMFIEFHLEGKKGKWADTSRQAGGEAGAHIRYGRRSTEGFTPRHWPGT